MQGVQGVQGAQGVLGVLLGGCKPASLVGWQAASSPNAKYWIS